MMMAVEMAGTMAHAFNTMAVARAAAEDTLRQAEELAATEGWI